MSEVKEEKIPKFNDRPEESFHLWRLRMEAVFENRDCMAILEGTETAPDEGNEASLEAFIKKKKRATALMVLALGDKPLKVVQKYSKVPCQMWGQLTARYAGKTTSNKLSLLNEVFSKSLETDDNITDHIGDLELCFTKLENAGQSINELMQVSILLSSIKECEEYEATVAAIRTMDEDKTTWETVTTRLIDEYKERTSTSEKANKKSSLAASANTQRRCFKCGKLGHIAADHRKRNNGRGYKSNHNRETFNGKGPDRGTQPRIALARVLTASVMASSCEEQKDELRKKFIIDSGATHHICCNKSMFTNMHRSRNYIQLGDQTTVESEYQGTIDLFSDVDNRWIRLKNVLYAPTMSLNLLSVPRLDCNDIKVTFGDGSCIVTDSRNNDTLARASMQETGLYTLDAVVTSDAESTSKKDAPKKHVHFSNNVQVLGGGHSQKSIWHLRLGHVNENTVREVMKSPHVTGVHPGKPESIKCNSCAEGKQVHDPHKGSLVQHNSSMGDVIFVDICGMQENSWGRSKYFLLFMDGASRHVWVSMLKKKSDAFAEIQRFIRRFQNIYGISIKRIHSDNGGEFVNNRLPKLLSEEGISHSLTSPYNPQSNGVVERMNRTIMNRVRCMLSHAHLDGRFWGEAVLNAVDVQNVIPIKALNGKTPFEVVNGKVPDLSHYRVFGCEAFITLPKQKRKKLDKRAKRMLLMGCVGNVMYRVFDPESRRIELVRHARFNELVFPGYPPKAEVHDTDAEYVTIDLTVDGNEEEAAVSTNQPEQDEESGDNGTDDYEGASSNEGRSNQDRTNEDAEGNSSVQPVQRELHPAGLRRSTRNRKPNPKYKDAAVYATRKRPVYTADEPSMSMAMNSNERELWIEAINSELAVLREREVWELVPRPDGQRVLPNKFVLRLKRHADGSVDKYKARLVILGCKQQVGDYDQLYSPVLDFSTVRLALTIAGVENAHVHQMDVTSAFLHGELNENLYMEQPKGFEDNSKPGHVCKLRKSLYGLKQAPRVWYFHLNDKLLGLGFSKLDHAESAWVIHNGGETLFVFAYVDDMLLVSKSNTLMKHVKDDLMKTFKIKDLGRVTEFLGVAIGKLKNGSYFLTQEAYIHKMLEEFDMADCKPVSTPMDPSMYEELTVKVAATDSELLEMSGIRYREAIGSLLYLSTRTRPDIAVAVGALSRHVSNARPIHWKGVKRILRYLKGTANVALHLAAQNNTLSAHADSDWGGAADRYSISGYVILLGGAPITWKSAKQACIALSSTEAEYISLSSAAREVSWLRNLLSDMDFVQEEATNIYQDNDGSLVWATDISNFKRNKHIDIRLHHVRDLVKKEVIHIEPISTNEMLADSLTKPLYGPALKASMANLQLANAAPSGRELEDGHIVTKDDN